MWLPRCHSDKESAYQCRRCNRFRFDSWFWKIPWRRKWQPTPVFLPEKFHGQRILVGYSPWVTNRRDLVTEHTQYTHMVKYLIHTEWRTKQKCTVQQLSGGTSTIWVWKKEEHYHIQKLSLDLPNLYHCFPFQVTIILNSFVLLYRFTTKTCISKIIVDFLRQHFLVFSDGYVLFERKINQKEKGLGSGNRGKQHQNPQVVATQEKKAIHPNWGK